MWVERIAGRKNTFKVTSSFRKVLKSRSQIGKRNVQGPRTKWTDDLIKAVGSLWMQATSDPSDWRSMEDACVQQWISYGWYDVMMMNMFFSWGDRAARRTTHPVWKAFEARFSKKNPSNCFTLWICQTCKSVVVNQAPHCNVKAVR